MTFLFSCILCLSPTRANDKQNFHLTWFQSASYFLEQGKEHRLFPWRCLRGTKPEEVLSLFSAWFYGLCCSEPCYSKCYLLTSSISITWELVKNVDSWAPDLLDQNLRLCKILRRFVCLLEFLEFWEILAGLTYLITTYNQFSSHKGFWFIFDNSFYHSPFLYTILFILPFFFFLLLLFLLPSTSASCT